jgi:hypothetical protein
VTQSSTARSVSVAALLCIGLAACGGGTSNAASDAPGTTKAAGGTTAPVPVAKASGNGSDFCKLEADSMKKAQSEATSVDGTTPAALRERYRTLRQTEQPAIDSAPGELRSDLNLLLDASVKYGDELAKVDFDMRRVTAAASAPFTSARVRAASTHVLTYLKQQCGIDITGGATTP